MNMDSSKNVLNKLRELDNVLSNVSEAEKKWAAHQVRSEAKAERNVLQCPKGSLETMRKLRLEMRDLSKHSMGTQSKLQLLGHSSQKMLNTSAKILQYLEAETAKTEDHLQSYGYTPLRDCSRIKAGESGTSFSFSDNSTKCKPNVKMSATETSQEKSDIGEVEVNLKNSSESSFIMSAVPKGLVVKPQGGEPFFSMPKSPEAPSIDEKFGSISLHSPKDPLMEGSGKNKYEPYQNLKNEFAALPDSPVLKVDDIGGEAKDSNAQKFFNTPGVLSKPNAFKCNMPYFDAIVQSPLSPDVKEPPALKSVEFKLHSNKSALAQAPHEASHNFDDDTIYMLGGGSKRLTHTAHLPNSPDFTTFGVPKLQDPLDDMLPDTPQSPDLTEYKKDTKENIAPSRYHSYEINQAEYDELPFYLKRALPFNIVNDCLAKVMKALTALPGEAHSTAITEKLISDITNLGDKTRLFTSLLQCLKIVQKRHSDNTDYLEIII